MKREVLFSTRGFADLTKHTAQNSRLGLKVLELLEEVARTPFTGRGKPEPLKGNLAGFWSRRIDDEHRLLYKVEEEYIRVHRCYGHYDDK